MAKMSTTTTAMAKPLLAVLAVGACVGQMLVECSAYPRPRAAMDNLITFGDSFTDEGRAEYFMRHRAGPPPGSVLPPSNTTFSGGYSWSRLVARLSGAASYNYAVGGAMCSDAVADRSADVMGGRVPSVLDYEVPAFEADVAHAAGRGDDPGPGCDPSPRSFPDRRRLRPDNSVYAVWIGTNDLGINGFLGSAQRPGQTLASFADCVWAVFDRIHRAGGRRLVLVNQLPLELAPLYARPGVFGPGGARSVRDPAAHNVTESADKLRQYTTAVNALFDYGVPLNLRVRSRWPGATFSLLDAHAIVADVDADPARHLDAPANASAPYNRCTPACAHAPEPLSSFMWFDELHPSERMHEILATHFTDLVVHGHSKYGVTYHG